MPPEFIAFHSTSATIAAPMNAMRKSMGTTSATEVSGERVTRG
jgi:hypothetical protein